MAKSTQAVVNSGIDDVNRALNMSLSMSSTVSVFKFLVEHTSAGQKSGLMSDEPMDKLATDLLLLIQNQHRISAAESWDKEN